MEMVEELFVSCPITTSVDGSHDNKIGCFNGGQPCEAGRRLLQSENQKLLDASLDDYDTDPFASNIDEAETENEVLIVLQGACEEEEVEEEVLDEFDN